MEDLFTLIVIVIVVVSFVSKIKAAQKTQQGATPSKAGGWITKLNTFLADIQNRMEQQAKEGPDGASDWRRLMEAGKAGAPSSDAGDEGLDDLVFEEQQAPPRPKRKSAAKPARKKTAPSDIKPIIPDAPQPQASRDSRLSYPAMGATRSDLRKAIIWSEILGPPVALKERP